MNFNIRMGIPEMQELWLDLQEKYRSGNIKKKEEQLYKKWGKATVNFVFDRYMSLKNNLKPTTKSNYLYMYDRFIRDTFGKRNIAEIKYSDVVQFYNHLTKKQELRWLMTTFQQVQSSIKMNGNANRD